MQFKQWLEGNFAKDENGIPRVFYHGTNSDFSKFDFSRTTGQMGFHFGSENQARSINGEEGAKYLFLTHLNIKNPLRLEDQGAWYGDSVVKMVNKALGIKMHSSASDRQIAKAIRMAGYDSVVYNNKFEEDEGDSYIVFTPEQIHVLDKVKTNHR